MVKPLSDEVLEALAKAEEKLGEADLDLLLCLVGRLTVLRQWRRFKEEAKKRADEHVHGSGE